MSPVNGSGTPNEPSLVPDLAQPSIDSNVKNNENTETEGQVMQKIKNIAKKKKKILTRFTNK